MCFVGKLLLYLLFAFIAWYTSCPCAVPPQLPSTSDIWALSPLCAIEKITGLTFGTPCPDLKESPQAYVISFDVPGFKSEEIKLEVKDINELVITGKKNHVTKGDGIGHNSRNNLYRTFRLPVTADMKAIKAVLENGVLRVTVLKLAEEVERRKTKPVSIDKENGGDYAALIYNNEM